MRETLNRIFAFKSAKYFIILDWRLGLVRVLAMGCVFTWLVGYEMIYKGVHLEYVEIRGSQRLQIQQPTYKNCNPYHVGCRSYFRRKEDLPYCFISRLPHPEKRHCKFYDGLALRMNFLGAMVVPTYIETFNMVGDFQSNGGYFDFLDENGDVERGNGSAAPVTEFYVADVERMTILVDHSLISLDSSLFYEDDDMEGFYVENSIEKRIPSARNRPKSQKYRPAESSLLDRKIGQRKAAGRQHQLDSAVDIALQKALRRDADIRRSAPANASVEVIEKIPIGDIFSIGTLLRLGGLSLDDVIVDKDGKYVGNDRTGRSRGVSMTIRLLYSNTEPFLGFKVTPYKDNTPHYIFSVVASKQTGTSKFQFRNIEQGGEDVMSEQRRVREYHGIQVKVEQIGHILRWNTWRLFTILTTSLGFMAAADFLIHVIFSHFITESRQYIGAKYEVYKKIKGTLWCCGDSDSNASEGDEGTQGEDSRAHASGSAQEPGTGHDSEYKPSKMEVAIVAGAGAGGLAEVLM